MTGATAVDQQAVLPQVATPCLGKLSARPWHATLALRTGAWIVGVRVNTRETAAWLEDAFGALRAPDLDTAVHPNFSVELSGSGGRGRRLQLVYRDHEVVARRSGADDLLCDLAMLLDEAPRLAALERLAVFAGGVEDEVGRVTLVPGRMHTALLTRRRRLEAAGLRVLPLRTQLLEPASGELDLELVDDTLAGIARNTGHVADRRTVRTWCLPALGPDLHALSPAAGVYAGCQAVLNRYTIGVGSVLRSLSMLPAPVRMMGVPSMSSSELAGTVIELAGGPGH